MPAAQAAPYRDDFGNVCGRTGNLTRGLSKIRCISNRRPRCVFICKYGVRMTHCIDVLGKAVCLQKDPTREWYLGVRLKSQ